MTGTEVHVGACGAQGASQKGQGVVAVVRCAATRVAERAVG